jgi:allene oxide cyclase
MKKSLILVTTSSAITLILATIIFTLSSGAFTVRAHSGKNIHVLEHAITDTVAYITPNHDQLGLELGFANPVYNPADTKQVGSDNGNCTRTAVGVSWECIWTVFLSGGQITVEGPYYDNPAHDSMLAITGGTGAYQEASGEMRLHDHFGPGPQAGTEYDFYYMLSN